MSTSLRGPIFRGVAVFVLVTALYAVALQLTQLAWPGEVGRASAGAALGAAFGYLEFRRARHQRAQ